jgi:hypothetical protein
LFEIVLAINQRGNMVFGMNSNKTQMVIHPAFNRLMNCEILEVNAEKTLVIPFARVRRAGASMWADNTAIRKYSPVWVASNQVAATARELGY